MIRLSPEEAARRGHPVWAEIDLGALRHNVRELRRRAGGAEVMGVVKGYAYGHGNPASAEAMLQGGASRLGVARVAEALHLRDAGITAPVHVFSEPPPAAAGVVIDRQLTATVYTEAFARALSDEAVSRGTTVPVHVKLDTGMHRVGLPADEVPDALRLLKSLRGIEIEGAWSHLAVADTPEHPFNRKQLDLFRDLLGAFERAGISLRYRHLANSAATLALPETHFDLVRPGVACYGLWPGQALEGAADLRPVMSLRARINMAKEVPAGDALSYGLTYELRRTGRVVTVPAGYADGYARGLSGRADVLIRGRRFKVSGTVCMDQFMVDVGDEEIEIGDIVTLVGRDGDERVTAEELAALLGTINYEVASRIPSRVPRLYVDEDESAAG
ncbi:MAG TPA: alanine racemase [Actinomycetota bacterium]|jgi:alanine racemase|nr:alanine racemase [Actinomycetota bacterium]